MSKFLLDINGSSIIVVVVLFFFIAGVFFSIELYLLKQAVAKSFLVKIRTKSQMFYYCMIMLLFLVNVLIVALLLYLQYKLTGKGLLEYL